uniref:Fatty-acid and retinol-binding protein 1 n=1 Tax=Wuchereria bancrofti TaxID=6293 RepID=A0A1I8EGH0_WUCBA
MIVKFFFGAIFCVSKMTLEVHESVQYELRNFYSSLNEEEKAQLKKFAKASATNFSFTNVQFLDSLKNEAAELFNKITGLREVINKKLDTMQPESRLFIENLLRRFLAAFSQDGIMNILEALKGYGKEVIDMFNGLSKPIQDDILKAFPTIGLYVTNDITRLMLRKLAGLDLIFKASTKTPTVGQILDDSGKDFPSSQLVEPKDPANFDAEDNIRLEKKKLVTTTIYPSNNDELLPAGKLASNRTDITSLAIELLEFIPSSLLTFFGDLNDTDRSALLELTRNISRSRLTADTEKEFLEGLKRKSENAYQKVMGVQNYLSHKIERLKPESKSFTKKVSDKYISLFTNPQTAPKGTFMKMKSFVNETFKIYDHLSEAAKNDLEAAFPEIAQLIRSTLLLFHYRKEDLDGGVIKTFFVLDKGSSLTFSDPRFRDYMKRVFDSADVKRAFNRADRMINPKQ